VPPARHLVPRYAAEPPHRGIPEGQWRDRLEREFLAAAQTVADDAGEPGEIVFYPDRTWHGRTYVPASAATATGMEVYGYVVFVPADDPLDEPTDFAGHADFTEQTAEQNPDWELDLSDEVIGAWHGRDDDVASMTLVWGRSLIAGGTIATAELGGVSVDECPVDDRRFTLLAPDDYAGELLEVHLYSDDGDRLARESLYE
jgi:fermentation-respiration switch protein FrsA (DUF1100 family)